MGALVFLLVVHLDFRAVWVPRWSIDEGGRIFSYLEGEFNHIFLQVFALGESYYPSYYAPVKKNSDVWLENFIDEAHRRNIRVSAWINVFYSWGYAPLTGHSRHPINYQPHWYVVDKNGRSILDYSIDELKALGIEGYYLAPSNEQVREYLAHIIEEVMTQYAFDGIHLDYIRYPGDDFTYDPWVRSEFMRAYGIDPIELLNPEEAKIRYSVWGYEDLTVEWRQFVRDDLTKFVHQLRVRLKAKRPDILISAAVKPNHQSARYDYCQDWLAWLDNGDIDLACLMSYTSHITQILKRAQNTVREPQRVAVGIGVYMLSPEQVESQVDQVRSSPFAGVAFFSYDRVKENREYLNALR